MIHLLLNPGSLSDAMGDSLDPHAVIVPQREFNAYDVPRPLDLGDCRYCHFLGLFDVTMQV